MVEDRENDDVDNVIDPNENTDKDKVSLDSTDNEMKVIDPNENTRTGSE
jgi:hypothetical protein